MNTVTLAELPLLFSRWAGVFVFVTGALVLVGWTFDIPSFQSVVQGWSKMAASSALAFVLAGFALWCGASRQGGPAKTDQQWRRSALRGCGASVAIIGLFKLSEFLGGWNLGMERLWFREHPGFSPPARMAPATAVDFVLLGLALILTSGTRFI